MHGPNESTTKREVRDAVIIGAGLTGVLALYKLARAGFDVEALEAGSDVGGTWYWNRYPGCRFDSESYSYQYFFSDDLLHEWEWSEHFAGQPEIEAYIRRVVEKFDLRDHITFDTRVASAHFDDARNLWEVSTEHGSRVRCRVLITAIGVLSVPQYPAIEGRERFRGRSFHTARWPQAPVDLRGKRVGVIGTSSSGVQVISSIAADVSELYVFQRTPQWLAPLNNAAITPEEQEQIETNLGEIHARCMSSVGGFIHTFHPSNTFDVDAQARRAVYEKIWAKRGMAKLLCNFQDVLVSQAANDEFCAFIAEKIHERVNDPALARRLIPTDHGYGMRRPPLETDYFEVFNRANVTLVDLRETPLERIEERGIRTTSRDFELDVIVYATGFDAITGAFDRIAFDNGAGQTLREVWAEGPRTYMGVQTPAFPNLFFLAGAQGLGANIPRAAEIHVDLVNGLLERMRADGYERVEATTEAAREWTAHAHETSQRGLGRAAKDWSYGVNTPGKKVVYRSYAGGLAAYLTKAATLVANGFDGFRFSVQGPRPRSDTTDSRSQFVGSTLHAAAIRIAETGLRPLSPLSADVAAVS